MTEFSSSIPIVEIIEDWLNDIPTNMVSTSDEATKVALTKAQSSLGYFAPFNDEQVAISVLLRKRFANEIACLIAWGIYHDYRSIENTV